jgi:hypothetical protein
METASNENIGRTDHPHASEQTGLAVGNNMHRSCESIA